MCVWGGGGGGGILVVFCLLLHVCMPKCCCVLRQVFSDWGEFMRDYYDKDDFYRRTDMTLNYVGYWTDKGKLSAPFWFISLPVCLSLCLFVCICDVYCLVCVCPLVCLVILFVL